MHAGGNPHHDTVHSSQDKSDFNDIKSVQLNPPPVPEKDPLAHKKLAKFRSLDQQRDNNVANEQVSQNIFWNQHSAVAQPKHHGNIIGPSGKGRVRPSIMAGGTMQVSLENDQFTPAPSQPERKQVEGQKSDSSAGKILLLVQLIIIFCYLIFVSYGDDVDAAKSSEDSFKSKDPETKTELSRFYPMFQDVHVMIFVGFGFLMTFLKKYGYSAVGYNLMLAAVAIQWSVLCRGLFVHENLRLDITSIINGDFAAGAVLISFGAVLGVTSPLQLLVMCIIEVFLYAGNEYIGVDLLKVVDIGGSMFIHTFGAYFGLAVSFVLRKHTDNEKEEASYTSDIFAMIGTVFLWMFWPSFNAVMATGDDQHRAVINTVLALSGSCLFSYAMSSLLSPGNKFNMVHVQNATLAGGVAVGASADLMIRPFGALLIGGGAGVLSTIGYVYITPLLQKTIGLHDTCGVHNLHGMPGVLAGIIGSVMALIASEEDYGKSLFDQYPARRPLQPLTPGAEPGLDRSASTQAVYQLAALGVTLLIAIVGGAVTGMILRIPIFTKVAPEDSFDDTHMWSVPDEEGAVASDHTEETKYKDSQM